ncbi:hypothetical protein BARVI_10075 [Barnesiella viscericola DSM 18177]|uniref:Uncharacterized protein n=1 Tax=Barnesiella viscericola DSM 18177 TaxID=880074 RepID=W0ET10_9BACT|nr:hypothetical protein [Barnesiella viscericola]AHF13917.1 hypothetical protein BARVI_10075 [Barnesiella viscericola DSM 18177]
MSRDSRIAYIITQLGELRELLLVIEQAGNAAPGILLKLAREKAEAIDRSTRELRSPQFWAEIENHEPFADTASTDNREAEAVEPVPEAETRQEESEPEEEPWDIPVTPSATPTTETKNEAESPTVPEPEAPAETPPQPEGEPEPAPTPAVEPTPANQTEELLHKAETPEESRTTDEAPTATTAEETGREEPLYPWEEMNDEELSAAQSDEPEYDDDADDYDDTDYEDTPVADLPADDTAGPVTLEEALQRQHAKELRKALSLNDRFRFRRELFGNSDIRMNETLALIDAMQSYDEAEDYILNDLHWDMDNPEVAEFMKIVQKHFL